ncbi:MAG: 30S ribosomal protein S7 [Candidatus Eisenbacteria bacterium]|uniref:Small ribosomal subunit protein uS7 n=1 Tax=Eiseniibacteriota bacterium TaxID=2212470 RepID=A0A948RRF9_UNCEI|nr:30S ribosomal protein S7 [Candidatus Eisenbacteria bacterium]MBU1950859.1 30S ribosomal protein S7 [Candidatus Eisenbacteria bacterium]MBU2689505.1 30S ribosomal protein S7 [Candidatus Eisenbacteria bacterium]
MPRRAKIQRRDLLPDPRYNNVMITRFINCLMRRGKRSVAEQILYGAIDIIEDKTKQDGLTVFKQAINNVKPQLEVKSRRVGGATYQVPVEVKPERKMALALRWLINFSKARAGGSMRDKLAAEMMAAAKNEGASIKKRDDTHRMAEANKAFSHYRF